MLSVLNINVPQVGHFAADEVPSIINWPKKIINMPTAINKPPFSNRNETYPTDASAIKSVRYLSLNFVLVLILL